MNSKGEAQIFTGIRCIILRIFPNKSFADELVHSQFADHNLSCIPFKNLSPNPAIKFRSWCLIFALGFQELTSCPRVASRFAGLTLGCYMRNHSGSKSQLIINTKYLKKVGGLTVILSYQREFIEISLPGLPAVRRYIHHSQR